ncbi:hypothetical protein GDO81_008563 [Engystomops pustulosus]|uniref:Secreted protein n=1 Tax=Engystomops pustulosus TaxID=76066 RepID=A0AAV7CFJ3_ENGPU|nr:hypothetical protein GDO81_008563 [Engystomops pustulosus]
MKLYVCLPLKVLSMIVNFVVLALGVWIKRKNLYKPVSGSMIQCGSPILCRFIAACDINSENPRQPLGVAYFRLQQVYVSA